MPSPRVLRLADQIKTIVAQMLDRRIKDPRLGFVTITDVSLTGDTQEATVFYTVMGSDADLAATAAALTSATGLIRSQVGKVLGLRHTPSLTFVADTVPDEARRIDELLAEAARGDAEVAKRSVGAQYAGDPDPYKHDPEPDDGEPDDVGPDDVGPDDVGPDDAGPDDDAGDSADNGPRAD